MCGIVGYIGPREAVEFLVAGLHRLEYRGYDSSGVATVTPEGRFALVKTAGRIERLEALLATSPVAGRVGIGHTRWATHGVPSDANAHPHLGGEGRLGTGAQRRDRELSGPQTAFAERGIPVPIGHRQRGCCPSDRQLFAVSNRRWTTWRR